MATKQTTANPSEEVVEKKEKVVKTDDQMTPEEVRAYNEELVDIELFYDGDKYADDVHVKVNGRDWLIQRGVRVRVPRFVAKVLESSERQRKSAARQERLLQNEYETASRRFGL